MLNTTASALLFFLLGADAPLQADIVIRDALLYDGSGRPGQKGNLAIRGERIVGVGHFLVAGKPREIDGTGLVVAPGFIDLHTHSDKALTQPATRANLCYLMQGVTTVVTGNCGAGPVNVAEYFKQLETGGIGSNVIHQVPHNDLRRQVLGNVNRAPTTSELTRMEVLLKQGMKDGAWGLSTGLYYTPGSYATTDELIALAQIAAQHGGFYASHMRDEGSGLLASVAETIRIGHEARLPVHISHLKAFGPKNWGKVADAIALINQARAKGQVVTTDQYPYVASSTNLAAEMIPPKFREGNLKDFLARLADSEQGPVVRKIIQDRIDDLKAGQNVRIAAYKPKPSWQGQTLGAVAAGENQSLLDTVLEIERHEGAQVVNFSMSPEDVTLIMKQPFVATASDGTSQVPADTVPHPRSYGCFPRKIGRYAIEDKVISLEHAIRSCSGLPADILKLPQRGYLKPGYYADAVMFDPESFRDRATFEKPHQYASGVRYLFVNGKTVIEEGKYKDILAGKVLRHESIVHE
jgi:N-acyl-D-aspartate/D-glutamate deacylase